MENPVCKCNLLTDTPAQQSLKSLAIVSSSEINLEHPLLGQTNNPEIPWQAESSAEVQNVSPLRNLKIASAHSEHDSPGNEAVQVITAKSFNDCLIEWEERQHKSYVSSSRRQRGESGMPRNTADSTHGRKESALFPDNMLA